LPLSLSLALFFAVRSHLDDIYIHSPQNDKYCTLKTGNKEEKNLATNSRNPFSWAPYSATGCCGDVESLFSCSRTQKKKKAGTMRQKKVSKNKNKGRPG
jgi:hypothetical protein